MQTPVNKRSLQQMRTYSWWKFLLIVILAAVFWNLFFTVTAYRPPAEKRVDLYAATTGDETAIRAYLEQIRQTEMSDMEEMNFVFLLTENYYGDMQLSAYVGAGEGDLYMLAAQQFQSYAANGAMMALEDDEELIALCEAAGIPLDKGWRTESETRERHLYGIPVDRLTGFQQFGMVLTDRYLSIIVNNGNDENSRKLLRILVRDMMAKPVATETDLATASDLP